MIYQEENKVYQIDCTNAVWSTDQINAIYHRATASLLSDVDFVVETEKDIVFVEYKNANIPNASSPESFQPSSDKSISKIARKYYDSLLYVLACDYSKCNKYVYILEYPKGDKITRKLIRDKIVAKLPFKLNSEAKVAKSLISDFQVLSNDEWNSSAEFRNFPISKI